LKSACRSIYFEKAGTNICDFCEFIATNKGNCKKHKLICKKNPENPESNTNDNIQNENINEVIYSIDKIYENFVYETIFINKVKEILKLDLERNIDSYNTFDFKQLFIYYTKSIYFNEKYSHNFSFLSLIKNGNRIILKENNDWFILDLDSGLEKLFTNVKINFYKFILFFQNIPSIREQIKKHDNPSSEIMSNLFIYAWNEFWNDLQTLEQNQYFTFKNISPEINISDNAKEIYKDFCIHIKSKLYLMHPIMKKQHQLDLNIINKIL